MTVCEDHYMMIVYQEEASPISIIRHTMASGGTTYGIATSPDQFGLNRPSSKTSIKNLYLAGANLRAGPGILSAMISGNEAAELF